MESASNLIMSVSTVLEKQAYFFQGSLKKVFLQSIAVASPHLGT